MDAEEAVRAYRPAALSMARRMAGHHRDAEDLAQAGLIGVLRAVRLWDPGSGASFRTFTYNKMRWAMIEQIRDSLPASRDYWQSTLKPAGIPAYETSLEAMADKGLVIPDPCDCYEETETDILIEQFLGWCRRCNWFKDPARRGLGLSERIVRLWLTDRLTQRAIADRLGCSEEHVCITIAEIERRAAEYGRLSGLAT